MDKDETVAILDTSEAVGTRLLSEPAKKKVVSDNVIKKEAATAAPVTDSSAFAVQAKSLSATESTTAKKTEKDSAALEKKAAAESIAVHENASSGLSLDEYVRTAEVNVNGSWERAVIVDQETEYLYKIHHAGTSSDEDEWVPVSQIRDIDSAKKAATPVKEVKAKSIAATINCSFAAPAPPVSNGDRFSENLAKRKIFERITAGGNTNNGNTKIGVTFLTLKNEEPLVNTVSVSAAKALEVKYSFAPPGAMIYPVKAQMNVCEQTSGETTSKTVTHNYGCFRNSEGAWACAEF